MRIPNPRLLRIGGLTRGAIVEQGDSELILTPVMQPVIELTSPIARVFQPATMGGVQEDSFYASTEYRQVGVGGGLANSAFALFARGAWILECYLAQAVNVVTGQNFFCGLRLSDGTNIADVLGRFWDGPTAYLETVRTLHLIFQNDAFLLVLNAPVLIAGETHTFVVSCNARRIL